MNKKYLFVIFLIFLFQKNIISLSPPKLIGLNLKNETPNVLLERMRGIDIWDVIKKWKQGKLLEKNDIKEWVLTTENDNIFITIFNDNIRIEIKHNNQSLFSLLCMKISDNEYAHYVNGNKFSLDDDIPIIQIEIRRSILLAVVGDKLYKYINDTNSKLHGHLSSGLGWIILPESYVVHHKERFADIFKWIALLEIAQKVDPFVIAKKAESLLNFAL